MKVKSTALTANWYRKQQPDLASHVNHGGGFGNYGYPFIQPGRAEARRLIQPRWPHEYASWRR